MRQIHFRHIRNTSMLFLVAVLFLSCKNTEEKEEEIVTPTTEEVASNIYHGEFIYTPEASVFSGKSFVYGVEMNEVAEELATRVELVKNDDSDIVPVIIQGKVSKKPEGTEGWDEIITITQIISVSDTPIEADVKI